MRAEIDLPNPDSQILPGMYAYGKVIVERPNVKAIPKSASPSPAASRYLAVQDGPRGADRGRDGVDRRRVDRGDQSPHRVGAAKGEEKWEPIDGSGTGPRRPASCRPSTDGAPVRLASSPASAGGRYRRSSSQDGKNTGLTSGTRPANVLARSARNGGGSL